MRENMKIMLCKHLLFSKTLGRHSTSGENSSPTTRINIHPQQHEIFQVLKVSQPVGSGIEYTIQHPQDDIILSDTNRGQPTVVFREHVLETVHGSSACKYVKFIMLFFGTTS